MEIDKEMIDTNRFECHKKNESISNSNCECVRHNDENQKFDISVNQISKEGSQGVRNGRDDIIDKNCKNCKNEICNIDGDNNESSKSTEDSQDSKLKLSLPSLSKEQVCQINDAVNRLIERNSLDMTLLSSVQFLKKIFRKILDFPYQEKYRKIRITSKTFKQNEKNGTRQLLSEVGWVSNLDDCLRLPDNNDLVFSKINCCLNALNSVELILLEVSSS